MSLEASDWFVSSKDNKKYLKLKTIGKGAFSNVYLVKERSSEAQY